MGLVSGTCFAKLGHDVICVENDENRINMLIEGRVPFFEPGLEELVKENIASRKLGFQKKISNEILSWANVVFICVGTPPRENGQANLDYVLGAADEIGKNLTKYTLIVTKSTVPVGTAKKIKKTIQKVYPGSFDVAACPEFLREGSAINDFLHPDRIVVGTESDQAQELLLRLHEQINCPKVLCNLETGEMIKYAANAFLAAKISFINEIANVCESVGADVEAVAEGMGLDKRIGRDFLKAGIGYGGSCFPKDVRALHHIAGQAGYPFQLLKSVVEVNNQQRWLFYKKIKDTLGGLEGKAIGVWGLSFKPNTDDVRESIALDLVERLVEDGAIVKAYDPQAMKNAQKFLGNKVQYCFTAEYATENVDCLLLLTDWDDFNLVDFVNLKSKMRAPLIIDGRNFFDRTKLEALGFRLITVGRG